MKIGSESTRAVRLGLLALVWLVLGTVVVDDVLAQRGGGRGGGRGAGGRGDANAEREVYAIVQVGDEVRMVQADEVQALADEVKKSNTEALKQWNDAKKIAKDEDRKFEDPKPKPERFKVLAKSVNGRREAAETRDKYQEKLLASMKGKYCVVQYDREYRVVEKNEISKLRRAADEEFRKKLDELRKARGGSDGDERGSRADRPRPTQIRILPKTFATEKEAHEYINGLPAPSPERDGPGRGEGRERGEGGGRRGGGDGEGRRGGGRGGDGN